MSPALGGYDPRTSFGNLRGTKPQVPHLLFTLKEEEIVQVLMAQGCSEKTARREAAEFMLYKERTVGPRQVWSDDDDQPKPETKAVTKSFADAVAEQRKGE